MFRNVLFVGLLVTFVCGQLLAGEAKKEPAKPKPAAGKEPPKPVVNINTATEKELMLLPGIGKTKADAIVAYRKEKGNFKAIEDIKKVKGIGDKTFELLKPHLTTSGNTTLKEKIPGPKPPASKKTDKKDDAKKDDTKKEEAKKSGG